MRDAEIRAHQRAAAGDVDAQSKLEGALARIGRFALTFRGPNPCPQMTPNRPADARLTRGYGKRGNHRHQMQSSTTADALDRAAETRTRRAGRAACEAGWLEYLEDHS